MTSSPSPAPAGFRLVQFAPPPQSPPAARAGGAASDCEPSDAIRTFVFMSNLAAQEATGDEAASVTASRVLTRLKGSNESRVLLFGLVRDADCPGPRPVGEVGEFGAPLLPSVELAAGSPHNAEGSAYAEPEYAAFIHLALPLLEERDTAEIDLVFDAGYLPVPGEDFDAAGRDVAEAALMTAEQLALACGRHLFHIGTQRRAAGEETNSDSPEFCPDPVGQIVERRGYTARLSDVQVEINVPDNPPVPLLPRGMECVTWQDYAIPDEYVPGVLELLTVVSTDADFGGLTVEPINWTRERLAAARARLQDRRAHTLLTALIRDGEIVSMTELARHEAADPAVAEWTLTVTARGHRHAGLARTAKTAALARMAEYWPRVRRTYASHSAGDPAMRALDRHLGARDLSMARTWEKDVSGRAAQLSR